MFVDVRQLPDGKTVQTDICIVGGGLAGITLAKEFLGMPLRVGVLESGGLEPAADTEALNDVILAGERRLSLDFSRARFLGGTTNLWSGHHSPLNVTQLAPRDWVPDSEWPIDAAELAPFLRRAEPYLQLSGLDFNVETWAAATPDFAAVRLPRQSAKRRRRPSSASVSPALSMHGRGVPSSSEVTSRYAGPILSANSAPSSAETSPSGSVSPISFDIS